MHVSLVLRCSEQIRGRIYLSRGKISKVGHWLNNSVVSRIARGPGFESRSGHDFFLPCGTRITNNYTSHLKPPKNQNRRAAKNQIRRNSALIEDNMSMWRVLFAVESQISYRTSKCINSPHLTLLPGRHNPTTAAHVRGASFVSPILFSLYINPLHGPNNRLSNDTKCVLSKNGPFFSLSSRLFCDSFPRLFHF